MGGATGGMATMTPEEMSTMMDAMMSQMEAAVLFGGPAHHPLSRAYHLYVLGVPYYNYSIIGPKTQF